MLVSFKAGSHYAVTFDSQLLQIIENFSNYLQLILVLCD